MTVGALRNLGFGDTGRVEGVLSKVHGDPQAAVRALMGQEGATSRRTVASGRHAMAVKLQAWHRGNMGRTKAASERLRQSWHANIWRFLTNAIMQWRGVAAEMRAAQRTKKERLDSSVSHGELGLTREVLMLHELGFDDPIACKRALVLVDGDLKAAVRELAALEQQPERGHRHSIAQSMTSHHSLHRAESAELSMSSQDSSGLPYIPAEFLRAPSHGQATHPQEASLLSHATESSEIVMECHGKVIPMIPQGTRRGSALKLQVWQPWQLYKSTDLALSISI